MDAFEENLQAFNGTIYGTEMKDSLCRCFDLLRTEIDIYSSKIDKILHKIMELEGGV